MRFLNEEYRFNITENQVSEKPQPLGRLTLVNVNTSNTVTYRLLNPSREFVIGINDGLLSWTGISLDREKKSHFKFIIEVSFVDLFRHHFYFLGKFALFFSYKVLLQARAWRKTEKARCIVLISILDVNDCRPQFINLPYVAVLSRKAKIGEKVINVKAHDADQGKNGAIRFVGINDFFFVAKI